MIDGAIGKLRRDEIIYFGAARNDEDKGAIQEWIFQFEQAAVFDPFPDGVDNNQRWGQLLGGWRLEGLQAGTLHIVQPEEHIQAQRGVIDQVAGQEQCYQRGDHQRSDARR